MRSGLKLRVRALLAIVAVAGSFLVLSPRSVSEAQTTNQRGIDVSSYQGPSINWHAVAASGISFAYIRAGVGSSLADVDFQTNWTRASAAGVAPGAYLFFHPANDPHAQARLLIRQLQSVTFGAGYLVPAIDVETTDGLPPSAVVASLQTVVNDVQSTIGALPAIYASPSWWDGHVQSSNFTGDPLWVACWCGSSPSLPANNWGGQGWQAWQYTSSGSVPGIPGNVDLDMGDPGPPLFSGATTTRMGGPANAPSGQPVSFWAAVTPTPGGGTLTFTENGASITGCKNLPLSGGQAACRVSSMATGTQRIAALYSTGGGYFNSGDAVDVGIQNAAWPRMTGNPSLTVTQGAHVQAFWRGTDNHLWQAWSGNGPWSGPVDWTTTAFGGAGALASSPSVLTLSSGQTYVFWQGTNGDLWQAWYSNGWQGPVDWTATWGFSGRLASAPTLSLTPSGQLLVFWQGTDGHLWQAWYTDHWQGPVDWTARWGTSATLASAPTVSLMPHQVNVFWQGGDNHLWQAWYTDHWQGPVDWTARWGTSATLASAPTITLMPNQVNVFWQGGNSHLWQAWYTDHWQGPTDWTVAWGNPSATIGSTPSVMLTSNQVLVFWQGGNGHLWQTWYSDHWQGPVDWTAQWNPSATLGGAPSLVQDPWNRLIVFWRGGGGDAWESDYSWGWNGPYDWSGV